ncbi:MAG: hypothetical protein PF444_02650 [Bacteroidales bacterium]|nr:hypothetical protein [Bacteroidales bacterium]
MTYYGSSKTYNTWGMTISKNSNASDPSTVTLEADYYLEHMCCQMYAIP